MLRTISEILLRQHFFWRVNNVRANVDKFFGKIVAKNFGESSLLRHETHA